jgi:hypothetical protein
MELLKLELVSFGPMIIVLMEQNVFLAMKIKTKLITSRKRLIQQGAKLKVKWYTVKMD